MHGGPFGVLRGQGLDPVSGEGELHVHRLLGPERPVVVERGDPLRRLDVARALRVAHRPDELHDFRFRRRVVPRRKRVHRRLDLVAGGRLDFEQVLPFVIRDFVPVGLVGLLMAGLLAIASGLGISRLTVENSFIGYFMENTEIYRGMKLIDEMLFESDLFGQVVGTNFDRRLADLERRLRPALELQHAAEGGRAINTFGRNEENATRGAIFFAVGAAKTSEIDAAVPVSLVAAGRAPPRSGLTSRSSKASAISKGVLAMAPGNCSSPTSRVQIRLNPPCNYVARRATTRTMFL